MDNIKISTQDRPHTSGYGPRIKKSEWARVEVAVRDLHHEGLKTEQILHILESQHDFHASNPQLVRQLKIWNLWRYETKHRQVQSDSLVPQTNTKDIALVDEASVSNDGLQVDRVIDTIESASSEEQGQHQQRPHSDEDFIRQMEIYDADLKSRTIPLSDSTGEKPQTEQDNESVYDCQSLVQLAEALIDTWTSYPDYDDPSALGGTYIRDRRRAEERADIYFAFRAFDPAEHQYKHLLFNLLMMDLPDNLLVPGNHYNSMASLVIKILLCVRHLYEGAIPDVIANEVERYLKSTMACPVSSIIAAICLKEHQLSGVELDIVPPPRLRIPYWDYARLVHMLMVNRSIAPQRDVGLVLLWPSGCPEERLSQQRWYCRPRHVTMLFKLTAYLFHIQNSTLENADLHVQQYLGKSAPGWLHTLYMLYVAWANILSERMCKLVITTTDGRFTLSFTDTVLLLASMTQKSLVEEEHETTKTFDRTALSRCFDTASLDPLWFSTSLPLQSVYYPLDGKKAETMATFASSMSLAQEQPWDTDLRMLWTKRSSRLLQDFAELYTSITNNPGDRANHTAIPSSQQVMDVKITLESTDLVTPRAEIVLSLRIRPSEPCWKILRRALRNAGLNRDYWREWGLFILCDGQERYIDFEETPLEISCALAYKGKKPTFVLRKFVFSTNPNPQSDTGGSRTCDTAFTIGFESPSTLSALFATTPGESFLRPRPPPLPDLLAAPPAALDASTLQVTHMPTIAEDERPISDFVTKQQQLNLTLAPSLRSSNSSSLRALKNLIKRASSNRMSVTTRSSRSGRWSSYFVDVRLSGHSDRMDIENNSITKRLSEMSFEATASIQEARPNLDWI